MKKRNDFDERQKSMQLKYGSYALFITFLCVIINAFAKFQFFNKCDYFSPMTEALIIILIPCTYFSVATIFTHSYLSFSTNKKFNFLILADLILMPVIAVWITVSNNGFSDIFKNGLKSDWVGMIFLIFFSFILLASYMIKVIKDKKEENID